EYLAEPGEIAAARTKRMTHQQIETLVGRVARGGKLYAGALGSFPRGKQLGHLVHLQLHERADTSRFERHSLLPSRPRGEPRAHQSNQCATLIKYVSAGCCWNNRSTSPGNVRVPSQFSESCRPCDQTRYRDEPGRYSQRSTVFELKAL